jgi:hypothetical protein
MGAEHPPSEPLGFDIAEADDSMWSAEIEASEPHSLVDLVNRVLDKGVCITGHVTISVAGVDLVYLGLNAILTSVSTARERIDPGVGPNRAGGGGGGA